MGAGGQTQRTAIAAPAALWPRRTGSYGGDHHPHATGGAWCNLGPSLPFSGVQA
jgi:hypothetical protein